MWPFSAKAKLLRALESFTFYNDKGIAYARHTPEQRDAERAERLATIQSLIEQIGTAASHCEPVRG